MKSPSNQPTISWKVDDLVDVLDPINFVFCPGVVTKVMQCPGKVTIHYIGWGPEWDDEILQQDIPKRLFPVGTFVIKCKAWVKLNTSIPHWPCFIYIRVPQIDLITNQPNTIGESYLREYNRLLVFPCGSPCSVLNPYLHGVWLVSSKIIPFERMKEEKIQAGLVFR